MKITLNWLKDYVDFDLSSKELYDKFNSLGIGVESFVKTAGDINNVFVGQIEDIQKHPNADKLAVCKVNIGTRILNIVCGAKNFKKGDKVPVAIEGTTLAGGLKIENTNIRDVLSEGMLCSGKELDITDDASGLLILDNNLKIGKDLKKELKLEDYIYDLEILPNRPDYLGIIGIARILSAVF